LTREWRTQWID